MNEVDRHVWSTIAVAGQANVAESGNTRMITEYRQGGLRASYVRELNRLTGNLQSIQATAAERQHKQAPTQLASASKSVDGEATILVINAG